MDAFLPVYPTVGLKALVPSKQTQTIMDQIHLRRIVLWRLFHVPLKDLIQRGGNKLRFG